MSINTDLLLYPNDTLLKELYAKKDEMVVKLDVEAMAIIEAKAMGKDASQFENNWLTFFKEYQLIANDIRDRIAFLYKQEQQKKEEEQNEILKIQVLKQRFGLLLQVKLVTCFKCHGYEYIESFTTPQALDYFKNGCGWQEIKNRWYCVECAAKDIID